MGSTYRTYEYDEQIDQLLIQRGDQAIGSGEYAVIRRRCAFDCEKHKNLDRHPSCDYNRKTGRVHCWVCDSAGRRSRAHVSELLQSSRSTGNVGAEAKSVVAEYPYEDLKGNRNKKVRYVDKTFSWFRESARDEWLPGSTRIALKPYHHERIEAAKSASDTVLLLEGEKDVHTAEALGYIATNFAEITIKNVSMLSGIAQAVLIGDNDSAGHRKVLNAASLLQTVIPKVQVLDHLPDVGVGGDLTDWVENGHSRAELDALIQELPLLMNSGHTDLDNARMLAEARPGVFYWAKDLQCWFVYNAAGYWQADFTGEFVGREFVKVVEERLVALDAIAVPAERKRLDSLKNVSRIHAALEAAKYLESFLVLNGAQLFDGEAAEYLVNFRNGTYDLRTGELREHRSSDYITAYLDRDYNPTALCPKFLRFILDFASGDRKLAEWLSLAIAAALLGAPRSRLILFMVGLGGSGKSTLHKILKVVYGDGARGYSVKVSSSSFYEAKFAGTGKARSDLVRLLGKRLYLVSEIKGTRLMDHELLKDLSGGDDLAERALYRSEIEFTPRGGLFFSSNHQPKFDSEDDGVWKRLRIIPSNAQFEGANEDKSFAEHLLADEVDGITTLLIARACEFVAMGRQLSECQAVDDATITTREYNNPIEGWFNSCCALDVGARTTSFDLFNAYKNYVGREHISEKRFFELLKHVYKLKPEKWYVEGKQVRGWVGVRFADHVGKTTCPHGYAHGISCEICAA